MNASPIIGYEYSVDWFSRNIPNWDTLLPRFNPGKILEIGSYEGRSTCYFIEKFGLARPLEIHCVDTWAGGVEHDKQAMPDVERRFDKNVLFAQQSSGCKVDIRKHKATSAFALAELMTFGQAGKFDVIYVDGSHQAPDVLCDCVLSFHLLRMGGLIIFDDYLWTTESLNNQDILNMPKIAIDAFLNIYQRKVQIVHDAPLYQLFAVKSAD